jgi:hypothetical protein
LSGALLGLIKFTLPASQRDEVLRLLSFEGVDLVHLQPTLAQVVEALQPRP